MMSAVVPDPRGTNKVQGSVFEMFFLDRHGRFPKTEREIKALPMLYFQHQARVKKEKTVIRIQKWVRASLQKRRRNQKLSRRVQFAPNEGPRYHSKNDTTIAALEATKTRLKKKLYGLALKFKQETGRSPKGTELLSTPAGRELRKHYYEVKRELKRARNQLIPCAPSHNQSTVDSMSFGEEEKKSEDNMELEESVCSPVLHFYTPVGSGSHGLTYRSPVPSTHEEHDDDDEEMFRVMGYVVREDWAFQTPQR